MLQFSHFTMKSNFLMMEFFMTQLPRPTRRQLGQFGFALVAAASMMLVNPGAHAQSKKDLSLIHI